MTTGVPPAPPPPPPPATDAELEQLKDGDYFDYERLVAKYGGADTEDFRVEVKQWFDLYDAIRKSIILTAINAGFSQMGNHDDD